MQDPHPIYRTSLRGEKKAVILAVFHDIRTLKRVVLRCILSLAPASYKDDFPPLDVNNLHLVLLVCVTHSDRLFDAHAKLFAN